MPTETDITCLRCGREIGPDGVWHYQICKACHVCNSCGAPILHRTFRDCIEYLKAENERFSKLLAEAIQVRDAARAQSNKDLEAKREAQTDVAKLLGEIIERCETISESEKNSAKLDLASARRVPLP
jgi:hypothetical protein